MSELACGCGYDLLHPSGAPSDVARCTACTWTAGGVFAEHAGFHHWLDTKHVWTLSVYKGRHL